MKPEFAAVWSSDTGRWIVPLERATAQGGVLQLAYAQEQVRGVPVVGAGDRLSREDLAKLYVHYGLDQRDTATAGHTVHSRRWDSDVVEGVDDPRVLDGRDLPEESSAPVDAPGLASDVEGDLYNRTVDELRRFAMQGGIRGRSRMGKADLVAVLLEDSGVTATSRARSEDDADGREDGPMAGGVRFENRSVEELRAGGCRAGRRGSVADEPGCAARGVV